jgi:hypothetical protein
VNLEIITCEYCGVAQRRLDIEKYIEQLKADVFGWVRSIVPAASINIATVDSVARAQIFEQSIRGEVGSRLGSINAQLTKIAASPLFVPPFTKPFSSLVVGGASYSRDMLTQAAKFQGLSPFAQSDDQNQYLGQAVSATESLGYVANVMGIYEGTAERSYRTVSKNFESAAKALQNDKTKIGASTRMVGLAALSEGTALLFEGDLTGARDKIVEADRSFTVALGEVMRQPSTASWYPGIKAEKGLAASMASLVEGVQSAKSFGSTVEALGKFEVYVKAFESAKGQVGKMLFSGDRLDAETFRDVTTSFKDVCVARAGNSSVFTIGSGGTWVACWLADLSYSFETGALFMKKGQSVQERFLVSGAFSFAPQYISTQPQALVTDIFSVKSDSSFTDRFMGREKTLTTGIGFSALGGVAKGHLPSTSPVVLPFCTKLEAEKVANIYVEKARQRLQGKLRVGMPSVSQVVYVGGAIVNGWLSVPGLPASMSIYVGDVTRLTI